MSALRDLCAAYMAAPDGKARLECGCLTRPAMLIPCVWHRRELTAELLAASEEDPGDCDAGCCDPG